MEAKVADLVDRFAPELYYRESKIPTENIHPKDMVGLFWRLVPGSESRQDICIQYIAYFKEQRWTPKILDKYPFLRRIAGKLPGEHPSDYVPIFLYFKEEELVKVIFDICHYEALGEMKAPSRWLPQNERPKFCIRKFFRGLLPVKDGSDYTPLDKKPILLDQKRLRNWWNGITFYGYPHIDARLIIRKKLKGPFEKITTFLDQSGKLGLLFDSLFRIELNLLHPDIVDVLVIYGKSSEQLGLLTDKRWIDRGPDDSFTLFNKIAQKSSSRDLRRVVGGLSSDKLEMAEFSLDDLEKVIEESSPDKLKMVRFSLEGPGRIEETAGFSPEDIRQVTEFIRKDVLDGPEVKEHLILKTP